MGYFSGQSKSPNEPRTRSKQNYEKYDYRGTVLVER